MFSINYVERLKLDIISSYEVTEDDAVSLITQRLDVLCKAANEIRKTFRSDSFDICTITNGKSGKCSENCKFCAQSSHHKSAVEAYPLRDNMDILNDAQHSFVQGAMRFSIVTSGKTLEPNEFNSVCSCYEVINERCKINLCASHGLLNFEQFQKLKQSGVTRYHNNIETSRRYFPNICTTHTYDDKINVIRNAQKAGLEVCSGVIIGMGETFKDRIDMAFELKKLGIKSVPMNILNPIKGTSFENYKVLPDDDILRTIAIFRFILPDAFIRLAGGRSFIADKGKQAFLSGANATISGNMLTTAGFNIKSDIELVKSLGYNI